MERVPGVDHERIHALHQRLKQLAAVLMSAPRVGQFLREDKLIGMVRQRLSIPGGCCSFDVPTLHLWLHQTQMQKQQVIDAWLHTRCHR